MNTGLDKLIRHSSYLNMTNCTVDEACRIFIQNKFRKKLEY
jgi:hypothetical protein